MMTTRSLPVLILGVLGALSTSRHDDTTAPDAHTAACAEPALAPQNQNKPDGTAKSCGKCHTDIYQEWKGRMHAEAWTDPIYQAVIKKKKRAKSCYGCHIPDKVLERVTKTKQRKPKTRKDNLHEGVTCISCHEKGGVMHGPFGGKSPAHKTQKDPLFHNATELCLSCHQTKIDVVLPVGKDFVKAKMAAKGKSCVGCHMPEVERHMAIDPDTKKPAGEKRKGRSHAILGPSDVPFLAKAFKLSAKQANGALVVTIANEAGHGVPGLRSRQFHFRVRQLDKTGKKIAEEKIVVDGSQNPLEVLEKRDTNLKLAAGAASLEIEIDHVFMDKLVATLPKQKLELQ